MLFIGSSASSTLGSGGSSYSELAEVLREMEEHEALASWKRIVHYCRKVRLLLAVRILFTTAERCGFCQLEEDSLLLQKGVALSIWKRIYSTAGRLGYCQLKEDRALLQEGMALASWKRIVLYCRKVRFFPAGRQCATAER